MTNETTEETYWSNVWRDGDLPAAIPPGGGLGLRDYPNVVIHQQLAAFVPQRFPPGSTLIELGCGRSAWLPYFAKQFGFRVSGLDYSSLGCDLARAILDREGLDGRIVCQDFRSPPAEMRGAFDVVYSNGVVEHFNDTASCVGAMAQYLRPGGMMITVIPNMGGAHGMMQRKLNRPVYDIHVPLDREQLAASHTAAGLELLRSEYVGSLNFGVVNLNGLPRSASWWTKRLFLAGLVRGCMAMWWIQRHTRPMRTSRVTSPYILCAALLSP